MRDLGNGSDGSRSGVYPVGAGGGQDHVVVTVAGAGADADAVAAAAAHGAVGAAARGGARAPRRRGRPRPRVLPRRPRTAAPASVQHHRTILPARLLCLHATQFVVLLYLNFIFLSLKNFCPPTISKFCVTA